MGEFKERSHFIDEDFNINELSGIDGKGFSSFYQHFYGVKGRVKCHFDFNSIVFVAGVHIPGGSRVEVHSKNNCSKLYTT